LSVQVYVGGAMAGAKLKPKEELAQVFAAAGLDVNSPVVCSCGSGLTGCILALALHQVTGKVPALYDGSWSEWGALEDTPVATTPSRGAK
jgi:thiosulfate/3-mercaptopyruvate sulfurtransferase